MVVLKQILADATLLLSFPSLVGSKMSALCEPKKTREEHCKPKTDV